MSEIWKDIKNFEGLYQVSNYGRIKSFYGWNGRRIVKRTKILKPSIQKTSKTSLYKRYMINLCGKNYKVHRLVAEAFIPKIPGKNLINHKDFNPLNNRVENLEWCDNKENLNWSFIHQRNPRYTKFDKEKTIELYKQGFGAPFIAEQLNIKKSNVYYLVRKNKINRENYKRNSKYKLSIDELKKLINQGFTNKEISNQFNIPNVYVARRRYQIKKGEI